LELGDGKFNPNEIEEYKKRSKRPFFICDAKSIRLYLYTQTK